MRLGNTEISSVKLGSSQVQAVYLGNTIVWQNAPVATAATGIGQTSFTANWNAYTGAVYYLLDVSTSSSFTTFVYENQITTSTSYVVIGLQPNTTYYYRVRASTDALPLLDTYPSAAAAYSLRKLRTSYTGSAIRVRRALDNTEQDIGFVNNELDTSTLTSFCSGTNGFVTTWYDQSGNSKNATQSTAANQPQIVSSGSVITTSGKPSINFDTTDQLVFSGTLTNYANLASFFVNKHNSTADSISLTLHDGLQAIYFNWISSTADRTYYGGGFIYTGASGTANTNRKLMTLYSDSSNGYLQLNNSQIGTRSNGSNITGNQYINGYGGGDLRANMNTQELIIYNTSQVSNISGINTNINSFYSIY